MPASGFSFHCTSNTFMMLISGCCTVAIWLASAVSSGFVERSATSFDSSMACSWCGIMLVAKETSSAL